MKVITSRPLDSREERRIAAFIAWFSVLFACVVVLLLSTAGAADTLGQARDAARRASDPARLTEGGPTCHCDGLPAELLLRLTRGRRRESLPDPAAREMIGSVA